MRYLIESMYGARVIEWDEYADRYVVIHNGRWIVADSVRLLLSELAPAEADQVAHTFPLAA
jgi:hypothetical protein